MNKSNKQRYHNPPKKKTCTVEPKRLEIDKFLNLLLIFVISELLIAVLHIIFWRHTYEKSIHVKQTPTDYDYILISILKAFRYIQGIHK